jgi:hypothetical protein
MLEETFVGPILGYWSIKVRSQSVRSEELVARPRAVFAGCAARTSGAQISGTIERRG